MYGFQDPERALTPGWGLAGAVEIGGQTLVVDVAWHQRTYVWEFPDAFWHSDDLFADVEPIEGLVRHVSQPRYGIATAGLRVGGREGQRLGLYYQMLVGGFWGRFRSDFEYPEAWDIAAANAACGGYIDGVLVHPCTYPPYPASDEERVAGFVVMPGTGIEVEVWRQAALRFGVDLPVIASPQGATMRPRLTGRLVVSLWSD